jgi:DNA-binding CsgD family transcriptional regulator
MAPPSRDDNHRAGAGQVPDLIRGENQTGVKVDQWDGRHQDISGRELEIIELLATGQTNQEIASTLMISKRTVDNHVSNIFTKTGAKNRVALLNWAMDNGKICRDGFNCCNINPPPTQF